MVAELGTSHAYVMPSGLFTARTSARGGAAALLGADVVRAPDGRWLVDRVLPGESSDPRARSPFAAPGVAVRDGDEILEVDGRPVDPVHGPWPALAGTAGKPVELTIRPADPAAVPVPPKPLDAPDPDPRPGRRPGPRHGHPDRPPPTSATPPPPRRHRRPRQPPPSSTPSPPRRPRPSPRRVVVVPLHDDRRLRYQDWVAGRRQFVRARSDGRVGYLHVPDMMGEGWAHLHRDLRAEMGRDALIVDVRGNRGGHTSQLIVEKLARRIIGWKTSAAGCARTATRRRRARGPLVALTDEFAGSDGDIVTAAIKSLGLGPVIGTRTWGGVVGIDGGGHGLVDGTRITVPRYASWFNEFGWSVENYGVDPDTEVLITPDDWAAGHDPQLEVAVDRALAHARGEPAGPRCPPVHRPRQAPPAPPAPPVTPSPARVAPPHPPRSPAPANTRTSRTAVPLATQPTGASATTRLNALAGRPVASALAGRSESKGLAFELCSVIVL